MPPIRRCLLYTSDAADDQGRIIMLMEMKKINYGKSSYKDINELISDSAQAHLHIKNQIQKGQYKEKDKEPLANEALDKLQNLWNKSKEQDRSKEEHTLLHLSLIHI